MGLFGSLKQTWGLSGRKALIDDEAALGRDQRPSTTPSGTSILRPHGNALALEPRIMFDGAAATAADQQHQGDSTRPAEAPSAERTDTTTTPANAQTAGVSPREQGAEAAPAAPTITPPQHLLVIDSRVEQAEQLQAQIGPDVKVLVVDASQDGLAAISSALQQLGQVDSIQILSHGAAGQFSLGNAVISANNVDQLAPQLQGWRDYLTEDADIQLYGCNVGAGVSGQTLVNELARWTGADVGASTDATGATAAGGNWTLETTAGDVDKALLLSADTLASFDGLLATPTVTLSSGGDDVLLGGTFTITASFTNPSADVGYAPFIDLFIPATGKDGLGAEVDDGVTFVSATYQGQAIRTYTLTFDANGQATHPLAKDITGQAVIVNAADYGLRPGDQFVVVQLPMASIISGQPPVNIVLTFQLSDLADTALTDGAPQLTLRARGGFQFGNTSADDPTVDPSQFEAATHAFVVNPTMVDLTLTDIVPDDQTATGPNFPRSFIVTGSTAADQTLTNVVIDQDIPNNIIVTSIVPGANGTVTSITLQDGTVITDSVLIGSTLSAGAYLSHYEVTYSTLSGSVDTTVNFYVPEVDADGVPILNPVTGAPGTVNLAAPSATATWIPRDTRDIPADGAVLSGSGNSQAFTILPIVVYKESAITTDVGSAGASPGDTVTYTLRVELSDYFAFGRTPLDEGRLVIVDQASNGQTLIVGSGTFTFTMNGTTVSVPITASSVSYDPVTGVRTMELDLAQAIRDNGQALAALVGDLAFDDVVSGATTATITYQATIDQTFAGAGGSINEGDSIGNNATVTGTVLVDRFNTGGEASDSDATTIDVPVSGVEIIVDTVNGAAAPANVELRPGDVVTFRISYDLQTGDYESFRLSAYMPLPLFDVNGVTWTNGTGVGQWAYGPNHTITDTLVGAPTSVVAGNYIVFDFGDHDSPFLEGRRVEILFTMMVADTPFGDQRTVAVIAQSNQLTSAGQTLTSEDAAPISSIAEPQLSIAQGVVSSNFGAIAGAGANGWALPGDNGTPFTTPVTEIAAVNGDITGLDGADTLRMATAIENSGGGGAYDVVTTVNLPTGLSFVGGDLSGTLRVFRGDGTQLVAGIDYSVSGNVVTFLDPTPGAASLLPGRAGTAADTSGANLVVLLYDVQVASDIGASSTLQSEGVLNNYASVNNGEDFTPVDLRDASLQQISAPTILKVFADGTLDESDTSSPGTTGSNVVVGETILYDILVWLPEGTTNNLRIDDLIPPGLALDMSYNGGQGFELITLASGSAALPTDFNGTLVPGSLTANGAFGADGVPVRISFNANSVDADNNADNNTFVIRVRLVASNAGDNQSGRVLANAAQLVYSDPDGGGDGVATDRTVAMVSGPPSVTLQEPTLTLTQTPTNVSGVGVDGGDLIEYTIVITNNSGYDAYDISFLEAFPTAGNVPVALLSNVALIGSAVYGGGATNNGGADFVLGADGILRTVSGANIDISVGGSITLRVTARVTAEAVEGQSIDSTAQVQWTSLNGTAPVTSAGGERTGADGALNGGTLNDYRVEALTKVPVASALRLSRVGGLADTPVADGGTGGPLETVAVGEIIRYRVVSLIPEGLNNGYRLQVTLDAGLTFQNDGTIEIAIVSDGSVTSNIVLNADGTLVVIGNGDSPIAQSIQPDLGGERPTATIASGVVTTNVVDGRTVVTFNLGNIDNAERDINLEGVVIEFNVRVANVATNIAGTTLGVSAQAASASTGARATDSLNEVIVEPTFNDLQKQVESFTPNVDASSSTANVSVSFTQTGDATAYDVALNDAFANVSHTLNSITITPAGGPAQTISATDTAALTAAGITNTSDSSGVHLQFSSIAAGTRVVVNYSVTVDANTAYATTDAVLTWSSLPGSFTSWGGTTVGTQATADGERDGSNAGPNTYIRSEGAGLGLISGTLWDDSYSPTSDPAPQVSEPRFANRTITLTWAGADGAFGTGDDDSFTTLTDATGYFHFSALAAGNYRVDAPPEVTEPQPFGTYRVRIDADGGTLGQVLTSFNDADASQVISANVGYVQLNDAPVNTVPGQQAGLEDEVLAIAPITVADADLDMGLSAGVLDVTLTVTRGVLNYTGAAGGVTISGAGSATMTLTGSIAELNSVLSRLTYLGNANYNGNDTLTITTRDRGSFGDADGDGIPGEPVDDQLQDVDTVAIVLAPVNDVPIGVSDVAIAIEAGGTANGTPGVNPSGSLLANDIDVDIATNGDVLHLTNVTNPSTGSSYNFANNDDSSTEHAIVGTYGTLYVRANGAARYVVNNANPDVQALLLRTDTLTEVFTYTLADSADAAAANSPTVTITIQGANDTPVAMDDTGTAVEAGGTNNATAGSAATGNVLTGDANGGVADTDVDAYGESRSVTGVRNVPEGQAGALSNVSPTAIITGQYGTLTINANGSYTYVVDDSNATVQALAPGQSLQDVFSYQITDVGGLSDLANLTITIQGADDTPVATDDTATAVEAGGIANGTAGSDGTGNVLSNDTDIDNLAAALSVTAVRTGAEAGTGTAGTVGAALAGQYGTLTLNANGSYTYVVDNNNAAVQALRLTGNTLTDTFTYAVSDGTLSDTAQLVVTVQGANDNPVAADDAGTAVEAGGVANGTAGSNATGNVLSNDTDVDLNGETKAVQGYVNDATTAAGTVGAATTTQYGTLTLNADGSYTYVVDNNNATVQALLPGQILTETFTYTVVDALGATDTAILTITIQGADDTPVATDDTAMAVEAGGIANGTAGSDGTGNVLSNDTDIDNLAAALSVTAVRTGAEAGTGTAGTVGAALAGQYGTLTLNANGSYTYVVDNNNAAVQALRLTGNTLTDTFTYAVSDGTLSDTAQLVVTVQGANDNPVAADDAGTAVEAGGVANGTAGSNATGNVLSNDTDVDLNGETKAVQGYVNDATTAAGTVGAATTTQYGTLTLNADGSYTYVVDNNNATVQALLPGQILTETFTYTVVDALGATDTAILTITIQGADDTPVATDDTAMAVEAGGIANGTAGSDGTGNVLSNDTDIDNLAAALSVTAVRTGAEAGTGTAGTVGAALAGQYGTLTLNANGSYTYVVDNNNAAVQALRLTGNTLTDTFTYAVSDGTLSDTAQLVVTVQGANDNPVAADDAGTAVEAGGVANGTAGSNATGNVLSNDTDVDLNGETKAVQGYVNDATTAAGTVGAATTTQYGTLTLNADGSYTYVVDNNNATVQALLPGQILTETFTYTVVDALGATDTAILTITIQGADDTPVATDDTATAVEAGGIANGTAGVNPTGNVLANDTDVDSLDPRRVDGARAGSEADGGAFVALTVAQPVDIVGRFGTLTVRADGTYDYVVNNAAVLVERMRGGNQDSLTDTFTYRAVDLNGQFDIAQLTVTIDGAWDAPIGVNDNNIAAAGTVRNPNLGVDAVGNVLPNDFDVDVPDGKVVSGIGVGSEASAPTLTVVAGTTVEIDGLYGTLFINADGSYTYKVDTLNRTVQELQPGQFLNEYFTYEVRDNGGLTDRAQLYIEVFGIDNPPFTSPDRGLAVEAGGLNNGTSGANPSGNVLDNDIDLDGDEMTIIGIHNGTILRDAGGVVGMPLRGQYGVLVIQANGDWSYTLDNTLPEVQALRESGQVLREFFTYVVTDPLGETDNGLLEIVIDGRNDTPIAADDSAVAVEAGGIYNGTPGSDGTGNVLDNDSDVDGVQYGETKQVQGYASEAGANGLAGETVAGLYGSLVINADGTFRYVVDNANPTVQAMRTNGESISETFTYVMRDTAGAVSQANLVIVVRGANDNPVARDDSNYASDQVVAPQASGNVLPNDSDVDSGDALQVSAIRTGAEAGAGVAGVLGQPIAGRYGTLVINADGSYTYTIDMTNPEVLAAAGFGQVLQDVFTYTLMDRAGATDQAQLVIHLDISAPRIDNGQPDYFGRFQLWPRQPTTDLTLEPGLFVQPVVRQSAIQQLTDRVAADGTEIGLVIDRSLLDPPVSFTYGLNAVEGEFVGEVARNNALAAQLELARFLGRHGRVSLTADGLLADPSLFGQTSASLTQGPAQRLVPDREAGGQRMPLAQAPQSHAAEQAYAVVRTPGGDGRVAPADAALAEATAVEALHALPGGGPAEEDASALNASAFSDQLKVAAARLYSHLVQ